MHFYQKENRCGRMNRLVIFLLLSLILSQNDITTKEFSFYYNNDLDFFDFKESIEDFNGIYRIELISLDDIKFERTKKVFIEQCDLSFNLKNNLSSIDIKRCDNQLSFKKFAYIDNENHTLDINHSKYHMLSCTFKFWITGNFAANQNLNINNDGVLNEFYDNGKLRLSYNFSDGKKDGMQKKWYNNGQLEVLYNYTNGKLDGEQKK